VFSMEEKNIRSHILGGNEREDLVEGKWNKTKNVFVELCFFIIVSHFPQSVPFSLDSPGIGYQINAGEKRNPIGTGTRHTELPQWCVPHSLLHYISVHHNCNPDPTSDLTHLPNKQIPQLHKNPDQKITSL